MGQTPSDSRILNTFSDEKGRETARATLSKRGGQSIMYVSPKQAIPVVFLPGIMGSPLIATGENNRNMWEEQRGWAWFPDSNDWMWSGYDELEAIERSRLLDPDATRALAPNEADVALLQNTCINDVPFPWQEARRRGWGTVMLRSYGAILKHLEGQLRFIVNGSNIYPGTHAALVRDASVWGEVKGYERLNEPKLRAAAGWRFPVYAVGYNWLQSNGETATFLKERVEAIRRDVRERLGAQCEQIILVTHSMGGLVARAYAKQYPQDVLGVVHGVQPATGAATAYARVRAGWEAPKMAWSAPLESLVNKVVAGILGPTGQEVSTVFAGAAGPLELLPNQFYGTHWLQVQDSNQQTLFSLPESDPYEEIYKQSVPWWRLIDPEMLVDDENRKPQNIERAWEVYLKRLYQAQRFHAQLGSYYHPNTYAHCGADDNQKAWRKIYWQVEPLRSVWAGAPRAENIRQAQVVHDRMEGQCTIRDASASTVSNILMLNRYHAQLRNQDDAGDGTVPAHSGMAPHSAVRFFARMRGFDHQNSYQHQLVQAVTHYAILRMAAEAEHLT